MSQSAASKVHSLFPHHRVETWTEFGLTEFIWTLSPLSPPSSSLSPVLSELQSSVSFSARSPWLGPCFIQVAMVKWSVRFWGTTQSGILAAWRPSNVNISSLSRPLSVTKDAVQLVAALGAGRRSVLPEEAPGGHRCGAE